MGYRQQIDRMYTQLFGAAVLLGCVDWARSGSPQLLTAALIAAIIMAFYLNGVAEGRRAATDRRRNPPP